MEEKSDAPTQRDPAPGRRVFGRYTLVRVLGQGGMGVVWLARDEELGIDVALKFVADHLRWDARVLTGLRREVRRARELSHPGILRIHDLVIDAGGAAIAMEYAAGGSLADRLAARLAQEPPRALEPDDLTPLLPVLATALDHAHCDAGIVHRDLKPSNILLTADGAPKIADFGVSRSLAESATRTSGVAHTGTLAYMSPQQLHDAPPTPADDIYAFGATLFDLLAGSPPFRQGDLAGQIERKRPESIAARRRAAGLRGAPVPTAWEEAVAACLAKRPADRPASAVKLLCRLTPAPAVPPLEPRSVSRYLMHRRGQSLRLAAAALLALALVAVGAWRWRAAGGEAGRQARSAGAVADSDSTRAIVAWNLDGDGFDASGRGTPLAMQRALPTVDRFGRIDRAIHCTGTTGLLAKEASVLRWRGEDSFSVALWVRPAGASGSVEPILTVLPAAVGDFSWSVLLKSSYPQIYVSRHARDGGVSAMSAQPLSRDRWQHLAASSNGRTIRLYVDGTLMRAVDLGVNRTAGRTARADILLGHVNDRPEARFAGDLDEVRIWGRALPPAEIGQLAAAGAPPRFAVSKAVFRDVDDVLPGLRAEFGEEAAAADWEDLRRWHRDDARAWADEARVAVGGGEVFLTRGGASHHDETRRYFFNRFDGTVPDYYGVHDEIGGRTLVLGSWRGNQLHALARLPARVPRREEVAATTAGRLVRVFAANEVTRAVALSWRVSWERSTGGGECAAEVRLRDGRRLRAAATVDPEGNIAVAVGDIDRPERSREVSGGFGAHRFTLVVREGRLAFRAEKTVGAVPLFAEEAPVSSLPLSDLVELRVSGADMAELIVE